MTKPNIGIRSNNPHQPDIPVRRTTKNAGIAGHIPNKKGHNQNEKRVHVIPPSTRIEQTDASTVLRLHQAVRGFTLWFGKTPEVTAELRALVEGDLGPSTA
jgi:hypothetical protein